MFENDTWIGVIDAFYQLPLKIPSLHTIAVLKFPPSPLTRSRSLSFFLPLSEFFLFRCFPLLNQMQHKEWEQEWYKEGEKVAERGENEIWNKWIELQAKRQ